MKTGNSNINIDHVSANDWVHSPSPCGRDFWWLHQTQGGLYLVRKPEEALMVPTEQSVPCGVDKSLHRDGVWLLPDLERAWGFY
ncbi:hypothetical protein ATANTOWER_018235 [Ataeniobius toweri]|uniref:Uncharacterized protein n=1 Tax=Ataeniobius toweri TaxID=208326 RepID=A0ABU7CKH7_9TELE|nr:hypothetical protein [Ataeniobius toweri]